MREPELEWQSEDGKLVLVFPSYDLVFMLATTHEKEEASSNALCRLLDQVGDYQIDDMRAVLKSYGFDGTALFDMSINDMIKKIILQAASELHEAESMQELCDWQNEFLSDRD